jgi:hypothetical protein
MTLILTNNKLLIRIKDIYTFISRIYKGIKSDHSDDIIDFRSNNKEGHVVYPFKKHNIKDQKYQVKRASNWSQSCFELYDSEFYIL